MRGHTITPDDDEPHADRPLQTGVVEGNLDLMADRSDDGTPGERRMLDNVNKKQLGLGLLSSSSLRASCWRMLSSPVPQPGLASSGSF